MPESKPLKLFQYVVSKVDEDGHKTELVTETPKMLLATSEEAAKIRILTTLAKDGTYNPDKPNVEVDLRPFEGAR